mmetsp:Transcript_5607/g.8885  ORF Transcript_5607/g.8885 Transcript_5607/m.8885 type:complete len:1212 (-) Transcript_5607:383-4018(-)
MSNNTNSYHHYQYHQHHPSTTITTLITNHNNNHHTTNNTTPTTTNNTINITKKQRASLSVLSQRAVLSSKRKIWDSNVVGMDAAESAAEIAYNLVRQALLGSVHLTRTVYGAAKDTTNNINHALLLPLKEYVLLPTFMGVEQVWCALGDVDQLPPGLELIRHHAPFGLGEAILAPLLLQWWRMCQSLVQFLSHVAHSTTSLNKQAVREAVDHFLTLTKTGLHQTSIAIQLYVKRLDANVTRTLMHTQWKVLGSGPYATLEASQKGEVLDHVCKRYLARPTELARYELAAHIRAHNPLLYQDLFVSGLLQQRQTSCVVAVGLQKQCYYSVEEWLSTQLYSNDNDDMEEEENDDLDAPYLLFHNRSSDTKSIRPTHNRKTRVVPLYFRLPYINGERPKNDAPWQRVNELDRRALEQKYQEMAASKQQQHQNNDNGDSTTMVATCAVDNNNKNNMAQWYEPDLEQDVLIDQKRHAVSFVRGSSPSTNNTSHSPIQMMVRPTLWRFHGIASAEIRRSVWFVDTNKTGLQPYSEEAAAILEDAYLFLKWRAQRSSSMTTSAATNNYDDSNNINNPDATSVLTVQVVSPDGSEQQLVQFSSLTQVTAISKTLGGAISLFKRRVYRGVLIVEEEEENKHHHHHAAARKSQQPQPSSPPTSPMSTTSLTTIPEIDDDKVDAAEEDDTLWLECLSPNPSIATNSSTKNTTPPHHLLALPPTDLHLEDEYQKQLLAKEQHSSAAHHTDHLILVVHGIGEMLRSTEVFGHQTPTIVDCCGFLRTNHAQISPGGQNVEYIPVEWHEAFVAQRNNNTSSSSGSIVDIANVNDISLPTIPTMRHFANDVLMDVLYFMSPQYHDLIIQIVTNELNLVWNKFQKLHGYNDIGEQHQEQLPKVSIIGHSLGAIIAWDILDHQQVKTTTASEKTNRTTTTTMDENNNDEQEDQDDNNDSPSAATPITIQEDADYPYPEISPEPGQPPSSPNNNNKEKETATTSPSSSYPQLTFATENVFFLGAPIAVFLMMRNNNNNMMMQQQNSSDITAEQQQQYNTMSPTFCFKTCRNVFNIFHPYDPVAYRMEPLIHRSLSKVEPMIIPHGNSQSGFRVHYQTKRIWLKFVEESQDAVVHIFERKLQQFGLIDGEEQQPDHHHQDFQAGGEEFNNNNTTTNSPFGVLNQGRRIDYMLQEHEIENANEYVAALAAHSSYWLEKDLSLFVAKQLLNDN